MLLVSEPQKWSDAEAVCASRGEGGHLVTITNVQERCSIAFADSNVMVGG